MEPEADGARMVVRKACARRPVRAAPARALARAPVGFDSHGCFE
jgi:hypothetical protein